MLNSNKMFERPILIYSNYCPHSQKFINSLIKVPQLFESFVRINIDVNPETNSRNPIFYEIQDVLKFKITDVPTIIVDNGNYVLFGEEAFKWLDYSINRGTTNIKDDTSSTLEGFNSVEMGSFSDMYSKFGSSDMNDATDQSFQFLNRTSIKIETPPEDGSTDYKVPNVSNVSMPNVSNVSMPNVSMPNVSMPNVSNESKKLSKEEEMDRKFKQLLAERESFGNVHQQNKQMKTVNFNI